jgi:hypothetical protein
MRLSALFVLLCTIGLAACSQQLSSPAKVLKLGGTYNMWSQCIGHAAHKCGPENEEIPDIFRTAFAAEPECQGVRLQSLTAKERSTPIKDIDGYLSLSFLNPGTWFYQVNVKGNMLSARVMSDREIAKDVCRIVKGSGGELADSE